MLFNNSDTLNRWKNIKKNLVHNDKLIKEHVSQTDVSRTDSLERNNDTVLDDTICQRSNADETLLDNLQQCDSDDKNTDLPTRGVDFKDGKETFSERQHPDKSVVISARYKSHKTDKAPKIELPKPMLLENQSKGRNVTTSNLSFSSNNDNRQRKDIFLKEPVYASHSNASCNVVNCTRLLMMALFVLLILLYILFIYCLCDGVLFTVNPVLYFILGPPPV